MFKEGKHYHVHLKLNKENDKLIIKLLESQDNKQGYIKTILEKEAIVCRKILEKR